MLGFRHGLHMLCEISFGIFLFCYITEIASADSRENFIETVSNSNNVYHDIKKRLNNYPNSYNNLPRDDSYSNAMCDFQVNEAVIIKTTESTDYGAEFLSFVPGLLTKEECQIQCCLTAQCNLAVFKENVKVGDEHACYLFDCGVPSVCRFSNHTGYVSMALEGGKLAKDQEEKHESDLALLAAKSTTTTTTEAPTTTTTTTPPTTTTLSTTTEYKAPVGLFGSCTENQDCASSGTECLAGYCVCQERYRAQDGLCRRICKRFEVSCANHGRPLAEPQCVPIYDKCDGTAQCQDGSDEANCPFDSPNNNDGRLGSGSGDQKGYGIPPHNQAIPSQQQVSSAQQPQQQQPQQQQPQQQQPVVQGSPHTNQPQQAANVPQPPYGRPNVVASGAGMGEGRQLGGQLNPSVSVNSPNTGNKPIAIDSSLQNSDTVNSGSDSDNSVVSGGGGVGSGGIGDGAGPVSANDTDTQPSGSLHVDIEDAPAGQQVNLAEQSAVHSSSSSSVVSQFSTRGAVIALGLGLSVTALLLLFVGCRLRTVKTRIRRGRPLTSGEADYLINGMYL